MTMGAAGAFFDPPDLFGADTPWRAFGVGVEAGLTGGNFISRRESLGLGSDLSGRTLPEGRGFGVSFG